MASDDPPEQVVVPPGMVEAFSPSGGLDYLVPTSRILIMEARDFAPRHMGGYKHYNILDQDGRRILFAEENPGIPIPDCCCCTQVDMSSWRNWSIEMYNSQGISVMSGCRTNTTQSCTTQYTSNCQVAAFGQSIGGIYHTTDAVCCKRNVTSFTITDGTGTPVFLIGNRIHKWTGPHWCCQRSSWHFPLMTINGDPIGMITTFDGAADFANSKFGVEFPVDLDVKIKALLIYATIMIDYQFFDTPPPNNHHHRHR